jgi:hypothetical protein
VEARNIDYVYTGIISSTVFQYKGGLCRIDVWEEILPGEWFSLFWVISTPPLPLSPSPLSTRENRI